MIHFQIMLELLHLLLLPLECILRRRHKANVAYLSAVTGILLLFQAAVSTAQILQKETHVFGPFNQSNAHLFTVLPNASINVGAFQMTPDTAGSDGIHALANNSGRVFFKKPFKLWEDDDDDGGRLASFNTSFLINIFRIANATPGEGLAFLIAPSPTIPRNSYGRYLGLTNASTDGNSTNRFVAVKLATVNHDVGVDDNYIGLDVNGVKYSKNIVSLTRFGIRIAPVGTQFYVLWVEYDADRRLISVYMADQPSWGAPVVEKPVEPVLTWPLNLKSIVNQMSYFGFSASTGIAVELNCVLRWNISIEVFPNKTKILKHGENLNSLRIGLGVGVPLGVLVMASVVGFVGYIFWNKRENDSDPLLVGTLKNLPGTPREFRYKDLKKATNNFDEKNKLGQGGFGVVYKGTMPNEGLEVAVKKFSRDKMKSTDDFLAELTIINRLRHKHLVRLQGWGHKNGVLLLVYDYMPNGSLDNHIFCKEGGSITPLSWHLRYKIISGVASALNYLHNDYDQKVIHRDLKASNIMLDTDFNARLGDFGLARAIENEKTSYADQMEGVQGTLGYIAPECFHTGKATRASDVYGFGAVLLEVVCGRRPWTKIEGYQFLVDWVWHLHREGRILEAVDQRLGDEYVSEEAERILKLGLACSHPIANERPKMQAIVQIISGSMPVPHVPPFKPSFVWPGWDLESLPDILTETMSSTE